MPQYVKRFVEFNESTFGHHLISEIERWLWRQNDLTGVAITPSLQDEADLGYDAAIEARWGMLFLQFKIPEHLGARNAAEYHVFGGSYYRFSVKTDETRNGSIQHNVLCDLEGSGEAVFYASPCLLAMRDFVTYVRASRLIDNSVFPRPSQLGRVPEGSNHSFAYSNATDVRSFSEPGPPAEAGFSVPASRLRSIVQESEPQALSDFLAAKDDVLTSAVELPSAPDASRVQRISMASSTVGLFPFIVRAD